MNDKVSLTGAKYKLKTRVMGNPAGTIAYCVDQYQDFDERNGIGIHVIMANGANDGFSVADQKYALEYVGYVERYTDYKFTNAVKLSADWRSGYWDFTP